MQQVVSSPLNSGIYQTGGRADRRVGLSVLGKGKISFSYQDSNLNYAGSVVNVILVPVLKQSELLFAGGHQQHQTVHWQCQQTGKADMSVARHTSLSLSVISTRHAIERGTTITSPQPKELYVTALAQTGKKHYAVLGWYDLLVTQDSCGAMLNQITTAKNLCSKGINWRIARIGDHNTEIGKCYTQLRLARSFGAEEDGRRYRHRGATEHKGRVRMFLRRWIRWIPSCRIWRRVVW
jgi:hypothetical protein